jgi:HD superfamily phosphohydrolase
MNISKKYNDVIYGSIYLDIFCDIIIEHPYFQRLKDIKQLGLAYKVYENVIHSRFEHSIGVAYLCKLAISKLKKDNDFISEKLVILVTLAGLLHDIGHGPSSHLFDNILEKKIIMMDEKMFDHENRSIKIFEAIRNDNEFLLNYLNDEDVKFISDMILGNVGSKINASDCLIELLNNKSSIFDLDKLDYLNRDTYYYNGIKNKINYNKFIENMKIVNNNDSYELCYSYELKNDFENLFSLRFSNHFNIYQNVNVKKWEKSFEDVFDKSDEINKFLSSDFDIDKFCKLTDSNFKLNKCNYLILGKPFQNYQISKISKKLENTNLFCDEFTINHGSKEENPVNKITFFLNDSIFKLMNYNNKRYQENYKYLYYEDNKQNKKNLNKFIKIYNLLSN